MRLIFTIAILLLTVGCQTKPDSNSSSKAPAEEDLIEMNRSLITRDRGEITEFIGKSDIRFTETGTGLWYNIITAGTGEKVTTGDDVTFDFECTLINGEPCYSGSQTIRVGYADAGSGVTEGLLMMKKGSDYLFIIPPYLAYGHTGDGNMIPGRAILLYRIRIKEIN